MKSFVFGWALFWGLSLCAQYTYEPGPEFPYGLPNPEAPAQLLDWAPLIGTCDCISESRNADQSWAEPVDMIWRFKYIMNGTAVQDETLKEDGAHSGSIRQFIADSSRWYVHYYSNRRPSPVLPAWEGGKTEDGDIELYRPQKAPNGTDGFYKITFSDISDLGFEWLGEWVSTDESFSFPTWKIHCTRKPGDSDTADREAIGAASAAFSEAYMQGDYDGMMAVYSTDARIFPPGGSIISGAEAIRSRWVLPEGVRVSRHHAESEHLRILGDTAYDYGYYDGRTVRSDGSGSDWRGKYLIVWKKEAGAWKMYLDIWNRVNP